MSETGAYFRTILAVLLIAAFALARPVSAQTNVSYTVSTSKDDASSPGPTEAETNFPQNVRNIFDESGEWAYSSFDHRHLFVASGMYELPFFAGRGGLAEALFAAGA